MAIARQQYQADWNYVDKQEKEFTLTQEIIEKLDSIEPWAERNFIQWIKVNWELQEPDQYRIVWLTIPQVIDELNSTDAQSSLSARQGRVLYNYIKNLQSLGKFLSNWDSTTGLPTTNPSWIPYEYHTWDYYIISLVGTTNYRPAWASYDWTASTVVETEEASVGDFYFYDWVEWLLLRNTDRQIPIDTSLSNSSTNPVENRVITQALNGKQATLTPWANIQIINNTISATDTTYENKAASQWGTDVSLVTTGDKYNWNNKQDGLSAWANIQINWNTISATDTVYWAWSNIQISAANIISATDTTYSAWTNVQIDSNNVISATDTTYTAGTWISIDANNVISNTQTSAEWWNISWTLSDQTDLQSALDAKQDNMVILSYGNSTWNDFITAYNKNWVVYCRASSNSNPATWSQTRLAFMAYVNNETAPTEVEFQYYRSRADHNSAANQLDQVFVYKLTSASGWTWTVTERNTAAKATAWTWISLTYSSGNMAIANTWVTSVNGDTWAVTVTVPTDVSAFNNDAWYITANDLPTIDTSMSDSSTNAVQNKVIKSYVDTQISEATAWAVSDIAYASSWDWVTGIAPSKNAVYDKISAMDTTISGKQDTISDLSTIRSWASAWATAVQPWDLWTAASKNTWTSAGNVPLLDNNGKLSTTILPALAITDIFTVANVSWLTWLTSAEKWDVAIVTWTSETYILSDDPYSTAANWKKLATPTDAVTSVNSKTGAVTLDADDISDSSTTNKFVTATEKSTWNGKQNALATQTAYTSKGSATKVPQITTNTLGQVTWITEVTITQPTVNNSTITYTQWGDTITTITTNQSSASTVALRWDIFVTQTQYDNLPSSKLTDWNTYLIYE